MTTRRNQLGEFFTEYYTSLDLGQTGADLISQGISHSVNQEIFTVKPNKFIWEYEENITLFCDEQQACIFQGHEFHVLYYSGLVSKIS